VGDRARPLEVEGRPELGWLLARATGVPAAYRVRVSSGGVPVWDSGWVPSAAQSHVPYAGPALAAATSHTWQVRVRGAGGDDSPWSAPAEFDTGLGDGDWDAEWIRRRSGERDEHTLARRELDLGPGEVVRARAYVAAYHRYELRLNGQVVDRGAAAAYPDQGYYQAADVTRWLAGGGRVAVGVVTHWYGAGQGRPEAAPGLLLRLVADRRDGTRAVLVSDGSWRVARGAWQPAALRNDDGCDYVEAFDARADPVGWDRPGFDDRGWEAPEVVGPHPTAPFTRLRGLEPRLAVSEARPVALVRLPSGAVVADFGRVIPARPVVRFHAGVAGREVPMQAGYLTEPDGSVSRVRGTQKTDMSYRHVQRDGAHRFEAFTELGFRYLEVHGDGAISALVQHTEVDPARAATFRSSEPGVDRVFELALRSALYSAQDCFVDTPTREKGQFLADAVNQSLALMAGYGERCRTRKAIREFVESQERYWPDGRLNAVYPNGDGRRDIPDFTAMFPDWVWRYYLESGDTGTLALAYPAMRAIAGYLLRHRDPGTGLVTDLAGGSGAYAGGLVDWPPTMRYGHDMATAARTTVNVLAAGALLRTADAAAALGRPGDEAAGLREAAGSLATAIDERLRREDGVYVDGLDRDSRPSRHASQIANAYALAFGVAPPDGRRAVADHIAGLGMRMGPMTAHRLLDALAGEGRVADVVRLLCDERGPGWANVLARGGTFTWESWDAPETGNSLSHGWGATVVVTIQRALLGVSVTSPGAASVRVRPPFAGLDWAEGTVPTERGPVAVRWRRRPERRVEVDAPAGVRVDRPPAS
jgi:alpha-L-rhamnosidase